MANLLQELASWMVENEIGIHIGFPDVQFSSLTFLVPALRKLSDATISGSVAHNVFVRLLLSAFALILRRKSR